MHSYFFVLVIANRHSLPHWTQSLLFLSRLLIFSAFATFSYFLSLSLFLSHSDSVSLFIYIWIFFFSTFVSPLIAIALLFYWFISVRAYLYFFDISLSFDVPDAFFILSFFRLISPSLRGSDFWSLSLTHSLSHFILLSLSLSLSLSLCVHVSSSLRTKLLLPHQSVTRYKVPTLARKRERERKRERKKL